MVHATAAPITAMVDMQMIALRVGIDELRVCQEMMD